MAQAQAALRRPPRPSPRPSPLPGLGVSPGFGVGDGRDFSGVSYVGGVDGAFFSGGSRASSLVERLSRRSGSVMGDPGRTSVDPSGALEDEAEVASLAESARHRRSFGDWGWCKAGVKLMVVRPFARVSFWGVKGDAVNLGKQPTDEGLVFAPVKSSCWGDVEDVAEEERIWKEANAHGGDAEGDGPGTGGANGTGGAYGASYREYAGGDADEQDERERARRAAERDHRLEAGTSDADRAREQGTDHGAERGEPEATRPVSPSSSPSSASSSSAAAAAVAAIAAASSPGGGGGGGGGAVISAPRRVRSGSSGKAVASASSLPPRPHLPAFPRGGEYRRFLWGRATLGPDWLSFLGSFMLLSVPCGCFLGLVMPRLYDRVNAAIPVISTVLVFVSLLSMLLTALTDPGYYPRSFPPDEESSYEDGLLIWPPSMEFEMNGYTVTTKYCHTCNHWRPPRCSHCATCDACVDKFDHHCPWTGCCIGRRNYSRYLLFVSSSSVLCMWVLGCGVALVVLDARDVGLAKAAREQVPALFFASYVVLFLWFVAGLTFFHTYLLSNNRTTYEHFRHRTPGSGNPYSLGLWGNVAEALWGKRGPRKQPLGERQRNQILEDRARTRQAEREAVEAAAARRRVALADTFKSVRSKRQAEAQAKAAAQAALEGGGAGETHDVFYDASHQTSSYDALEGRGPETRRGHDVFAASGSDPGALSAPSTRGPGAMRSFLTPSHEPADHGNAHIDRDHAADGGDASTGARTGAGVATADGASPGTSEPATPFAGSVDSAFDAPFHHDDGTENPAHDAARPMAAVPRAPSPATPGTSFSNGHAGAAGGFGVAGFDAAARSPESTHALRGSPPVGLSGSVSPARLYRSSDAEVGHSPSPSPARPVRRLRSPGSPEPSPRGGQALPGPSSSSYVVCAPAVGTMGVQDDDGGEGVRRSHSPFEGSPDKVNPYDPSDPISSGGPLNPLADFEEGSLATISPPTFDPLPSGGGFYDALEEQTAVRRTPSAQHTVKGTETATAYATATAAEVATISAAAGSRPPSSMMGRPSTASSAAPPSSSGRSTPATVPAATGTATNAISSASALTGTAPPSVASVGRGSSRSNRSGRTASPERGAAAWPTAPQSASHASSGSAQPATAVPRTSSGSPAPSQAAAVSSSFAGGGFGDFGGWTSSSWADLSPSAVFEMSLPVGEGSAATPPAGRTPRAGASGSGGGDWTGSRLSSVRGGGGGDWTGSRPSSVRGGGGGDWMGSRPSSVRGGGGGDWTGSRPSSVRGGGGSRGSGSGFAGTPRVSGVPVPTASLGALEDVSKALAVQAKGAVPGSAPSSTRGPPTSTGTLSLGLAAAAARASRPSSADDSSSSAPSKQGRVGAPQTPATSPGVALDVSETPTDAGIIGVGVGGRNVDGRSVALATSLTAPAGAAAFETLSTDDVAIAADAADRVPVPETPAVDAHGASLTLPRHSPPRRPTLPRGLPATPRGAPESSSKGGLTTRMPSSHGSGTVFLDASEDPVE